MKLLARLERLPLTAISALLMAGSVTFFCIAMPVDLIERAVTAIGLPNLLAAAAPPLGDTARMLFAGSAGLVAGFAAWLAVDFADHSPATDDDDDEAAEPRRPIFAQSDLGTPLDQIDTAAYDPPAAFTAPAFELPPAPEPEEVEWVEVIEEPRYEAEILELVDAIVDDAPRAMATDESSVGDLAARFEAGLARRAGGLPAEPVPAPTPVTSIDPRDESALRNAIEELKRMAMR